jgi:hypothetical protein
VDREGSRLCDGQRPSLPQSILQISQDRPVRFQLRP